MKIGIIGAGNVGGTLGKAWAAKGHDVVFGVRDPAKHPDLPGRTASPAEAAAHGEIVFLTVPWSAVPATLAGLGDLAGKVLVDCTNPVAPGPSLAVGFSTSGGEEVAKLAPGARVVKGFHTVGAENMARPRYGDQAAVNPLCGDDAAAKELAATLSRELGWEPVDAGPLSQARLTEPLAMLWITLAIKQGLGREFAFGLLQREAIKV
jgi:predicted dinucleotide-binding enzyme